MIDNIKLRNIRVRLGLTQKQLAKKLHITQSAISHWENGLSLPSIVIAVKLVKIGNKIGMNLSTESIRTR